MIDSADPSSSRSGSVPVEARPPSRPDWKEILAEADTARQAGAIRRYGWEWFVTDAGLKLVRGWTPDPEDPEFGLALYDVPGRRMRTSRGPADPGWAPFRSTETLTVRRLLLRADFRGAQRATGWLVPTSTEDPVSALAAQPGHATLRAELDRVEVDVHRALYGPNGRRVAAFIRCLEGPLNLGFMEQDLALSRVPFYLASSISADLETEMAGPPYSVVEARKMADRRERSRSQWQKRVADALEGSREPLDDARRRATTAVDAALANRRGCGFQTQEAAREAADALVVARLPGVGANDELRFMIKHLGEPDTWPDPDAPPT